MSSSSIFAGSAAAIDTKDWKAVASIIDHTLLRPETSHDQVVHLCEEAISFGFCSAFVHPIYTALAASILHGSAVKVGTPIGCPLGASLTSPKCFATEEVLRAGVKASGGIRTAADVAAMVVAGANRIGTSAAVQIIHQLRG